MSTPFSGFRSVFHHYRTSVSILRYLLKNPLTFDESIHLLRRGLERREQSFLRMLKRCVIRNASSPYRILLESAGYGFRDVEKLVHRMGIENALREFCDNGVFVDYQQFKGKRPVLCGGRVFNFRQADFDNPLFSTGLNSQTGGSSGRATNVKVPLDYILHNTIYGVHASSLYNIPHRKVVIWLPVLPALEGLFFNLRFGLAGNPPVKWFSQIDTRRIRPSRLERLKTASTIWMARLHGIRLPKPQFIDHTDARKIARWMDRNQESDFAVVTYASSAFRLVKEAREEGINLGEIVFWLMGEPLTERKYRAIEEAGCKAYALYGCNELMLIGHACLNPEAIDEVHVCTDKLAVIQRRRRVGRSEATVDAFLFTSLLDISPKILINTEIGDYGELKTRSCNCPFDKLGFSYHLHTIRSFEKLTAEGMTFAGENLIYLVEELLPTRFGGDATNYQFLEAEDELGYTRLYLLVSPELGDIDEGGVRETIFEGLYKDVNPEYAGARAMKDVWSRANTIQMKRMDPIPTRRGKVLPLYPCKDWASISQRS